MTMSRKVKIIAVALICASAAFAERATEEKMAEEALSPYVGTKDPTERAERLRFHQEHLDDNTLIRPNQTRSASIVFEIGLNQDDLIDFVSRHDLTVVGFHLKAPMNDSGMINSVIVGMDDLLAIDGSLKDRLNHAIALQRSRILELANAYANAGSGKEDQQRAQEYLQVASADQEIYAIEAFGSSHTLSKASAERIVAGVFLDRNDNKIQTYNHLTRSR